MLDDRKILAIQHLAEGEKTRTDIAKLVGISRQTLYLWLDDVEFVAELDKRIQQRKNLVEKVIDSKLNDMVDRLATLAITTKNDMVKSQVLKWWVEMGLGKPTSKHELTTKIDDNFNVNQNEIKEVFDSIDELEDGEAEEV